MNPQATPCRCGADSQHRVFRYLFENPGVSLKVAAKELGMTHVAVRIALHRVKHRNTAKLCPYCFHEALEGLACRSCGAELDAPPAPPDEANEAGAPVPDRTREVVHTIQPLGGLGSKTNYSALHLQYGALNVRHLVESPPDPLLERAKSVLWQELKGPMFDDRIVEEASALLSREVRDFRAKYPRLVRARGLSDQLVGHVVEVLKLRYPNRFECLEVERP